jgi:hypothetical protein
MTHYYKKKMCFTTKSKKEKKKKEAGFHFQHFLLFLTTFVPSKGKGAFKKTKGKGKGIEVHVFMQNYIIFFNEFMQNHHFFYEIMQRVDLNFSCKNQMEYDSF